MLSSPLPPDIFCKDQNVHQVVHLTYTIWGANEPNGREYENCIETRLKSFSNGTQKYNKNKYKNTQSTNNQITTYILFHFGKGMRVGTTPPAKRVEGDFSASFQKSRFFISEASPIARCWACVEGYLIFLLENEIIFSKGISGFWFKDLSTIFKLNLFAAWIVWLQVQVDKHKWNTRGTAQNVAVWKCAFDGIEKMSALQNGYEI